MIAPQNLSSVVQARACHLHSTKPLHELGSFVVNLDYKLLKIWK